jgi:hypothetical protein
VPLPKPEPGLVISYGYLWSSEYAEGLDEGLKNRPCVIILAVRAESDKLIVTVVPVTHSAPAQPEVAVELPIATKQRLGLDDARSWVVISEGNEFVWPGPDLRPLPQDVSRFAYGLLPPGLFRLIRDRMTAYGRAGQIQFVPRSE